MQNRLLTLFAGLAIALQTIPEIAAANLGDLFPAGAATCFAVRYAGKIYMNKKIGSVFLSQPDDPSRANTHA